MYDINILEFNKVLETLKKYTITSYSKAIIDEKVLPKNYDEAKYNQDITKEAFDAIIKYSNLPLDSIEGVKESLKLSSQGGILSAIELINVVKFLDTSKNILTYFKNLEVEKINLEKLTNIIKNIDIPKSLKSSITLAISNDGAILDNASKELFTIRRSLKSLDNRLRSKLQEILQQKSSMIQEPLIVERNMRLCIPVKIEYKNTFKGIIHDISSSNTTCYIEPEEVLAISISIENFKNKEKHEIEVILKNLSLLVGSEYDILINNFNILVNLDLIFAKAKMGKENDYNPAKIEDLRSFNLKSAKHPLIDKNICVPIDINLGIKFNVIVITGPNTGGKTVALKTVGILHLMSYYGLMVPVHEQSTFGYFDNILADIGDEQSIEQSLSTFSSHMKRIINIIDVANSNSLILLDELGSGTDPKEGSSLAISIIMYLKNSGAKVISTTHYSELKSYAYKEEDICNASVEFNTETLMPTYKLLLGIPGKSNALLIASKLGLKSDIIDVAKAELDYNKTESVELMGNLEDKMNELNSKEALLEAKLKEAEKNVEELKKEKFDLVKKTDKIIKEAKDKAKTIIEEAKNESNKLISEIKNMSSESFKEHELIALKTKARNLDIKDDNEEIIESDFNVGDFVFIKPYEKYGTIVDIKKGKYIINLGQFQMDFKKNELVLSAKPVEKKKRETRLSGVNPASHAEFSLDLRGKRVEEVDYLLDQFFDQALLGNLDELTIIHGFGTGAVRKKVWEYLKKASFIKKYRYGGEGEGLNGVTIVYLK